MLVKGIGGQYRIVSGQNVPTFDAMLQIVDFLVAMELANLQPASDAVAETAAETGSAAN